MKFFSVVLLCLLVASGCVPASTDSGASKPIVDVGGVVFLDGEPVVDANVVFVPTRVWNRESQRQTICFGQTDEKGEFRLSQGKGTEGVVPGNYRVLISKIDEDDGQALNERNNDLAKKFFDWSNSGEETPCCWPEMSSEKIPAIYNEMSMLSYFVTHNSLRKVNLKFNLTTIDPELSGKTETLIEEQSN